ncbi:hypothetical protein AVEN_205785-2-1, partial [Araneus ventricosus]
CQRILETFKRVQVAFVFKIDRYVDLNADLNSVRAQKSRTYDMRRRSSRGEE